MKNRLFLSILACVMLISSTAFAGGGPPLTFKQLKYHAEYVQETLTNFQETGQIPEWFQSECHFWTSLSDNIAFYSEYETMFRAKATQRKTANSWKIRVAKKYGDGIMMLDIYKVRRFRAKKQLAKMDAWRNMFIELRHSLVGPNRNFYCAAEEICFPDPEPNLSTVYVSKVPVNQIFVLGNGQHLFSFALSMVSEDPSFDEDGILDQVRLSVYMSNGVELNQLYNCTLSREGYWTEAYAGVPIYDEETNTGILTFNLPDPAVLPMGNTETFDVSCDIAAPFPEYASIVIGFMPGVGTAPNDSISVTGMSTAETLEINPNIHISQVLTN